MNAAKMRERANSTEAAAATLNDARATDLLARAAGYLREGASVYESDPTLVNDRAARNRPLDLLDEIGRQLQPLVRGAVRGDRPERWPVAERWADAEVLVSRMADVLGEARAAARDVSVPAQSEEVSARRLASIAGHLAEEADRIRALLRPALELPHAHPAAEQIAQLAGQIDAIVAAEPWERSAAVRRS